MKIRRANLAENIEREMDKEKKRKKKREEDKERANSNSLPNEIFVVAYVRVLFTFIKLMNILGLTGNH